MGIVPPIWSDFTNISIKEKDQEQLRRDLSLLATMGISEIAYDRTKENLFGLKEEEWMSLEDVDITSHGILHYSFHTHDACEKRIRITHFSKTYGPCYGLIFLGLSILHVRCGKET